MIIKASFSCYHKFNGAKQQGRSERGNHPSFISLSDPLARFPTQFFEVDSIWFSVTNWNGPRDQKQIDHSDSSNRKRLETIFFSRRGTRWKIARGGARLTFKKVTLVILRIFSLKGPPEMAFAFTFQRIGCKKSQCQLISCFRIGTSTEWKKIKPHLQNRLAGTS